MSATYKYVRHLRFRSSESQAHFVRTLKPPASHYRWIDKKTLFFSDVALSLLAHPMKVGDVVLVFEESTRGQRCFLSQFNYRTRRENGAVFRAPKNIPKSSLSAWARFNKLPLTLKIELPSDSVRPLYEVQPCRSWMETRALPGTNVISSVRTNFFISSKKFSSVRAADPKSGMQIRMDPVKGGWFIRSRPGQHELHVRDAESGILQSFLINVENQKNATGSGRPKRFQSNARNGQLILLGWD